MKLKAVLLSIYPLLALICLTTLLSAESPVFESRPLVAQKENGPLPTFADYPAKGKFKGSPAKAKIRSKSARMFRTMIREGATEGPNFAGHYTIVQWGCGTGCLQFAIVDANTGDVFTPPFYVSYGMQLNEDLQQREMLEFQPGSNLLIITGSRDERKQGQYFYAWDGKKLKLVRTEFEIRG